MEVGFWLVGVWREPSSSIILISLLSVKASGFALYIGHVCYLFHVNSTTSNSPNSKLVMVNLIIYAKLGIMGLMDLNCWLI